MFVFLDKLISGNKRTMVIMLRISSSWNL